MSYLSPECQGEDSVTQTTAEQTAPEGNSVTLSCAYQISGGTSSYLFWYKNEKDGIPTLIIRMFSSSEDKPSLDERLYATVNKTFVSLTIQQLQLSDSAVYYCALRPTVTGNI